MRNKNSGLDKELEELGSCLHGLNKCELIIPDLSALEHKILLRAKSEKLTIKPSYFSPIIKWSIGIAAMWVIIAGLWWNNKELNNVEDNIIKQDFELPQTVVYEKLIPQPVEVVAVTVKEKKMQTHKPKVEVVEVSNSLLEVPTIAIEDTELYIEYIEQYIDDTESIEELYDIVTNTENTHNHE